MDIIWLIIAFVLIGWALLDLATGHTTFISTSYLMSKDIDRDDNPLIFYFLVVGRFIAGVAFLYTVLT